MKIVQLSKEQLKSFFVYNEFISTKQIPIDTTKCIEYKKMFYKFCNFQFVKAIQLIGSRV